jgi:hypothetical protein
MRDEHANPPVHRSRRSSDVTATNIEIISRALSAIEKGEEA